MRFQEFYCDKYEGTYLIKLSKKETEISGIKVECTYSNIKDKQYEVKMFIGIESYDLMYEYSQTIITSNYNKLKDNIKVYVLTKINNGTKDKLSKFINEKVIPGADYLYEPVGKIYKISSPGGEKYWTSIYTDKVEIRKDGDKDTKIVYGKYKVDDVINMIKEEELIKNENKAS